VGEIKGNGTPFANFLVKSFYFWGYAFLPFCIVSGIIAAVITKNIFFVILGFSIGLETMLVVAIVYVFLFLFLFSTGGLVKENKDDTTTDKTRFAETQETIDMMYTAHRVAKKSSPAKVKLFAGLFYGIMFLFTIMAISGRAFTLLGVPLVGGTFPLITLIGVCGFCGTIFGLIIFGGIMPAIIKRHKEKHIKKDISAHK
jgi:hypothetical protein